MTILYLPIVFLQYWFLDAPKEILHYFLSLNRTFVRFLSFDLLLKTFFKPLKNEYREGLVAFSITAGIVVKTVLILFDLCICAALLVLEVALFLVWLLLPIITIWLFFARL